MLPLRYTSDSTVSYSVTIPNVEKKILTHYTSVQQNTPYFQSMECGYMMKQNIISAKFGKPGRPGNPPPYGNGQPDQIDSLHIKNKEANTNEIENLQIFYNYRLITPDETISLLLLFCIGLPASTKQQRPAQPPKEIRRKKRMPR